MEQVHVKAQGSVMKSEVVQEDEEGIASIDQETTAEGMKSMDSQDVGQLLLKGKKALCEYVVDLENTDYYISNIDDWEVTLSGRNESLPVAIAADLAEQNGRYKNALEALVDWSNQSDFPFTRTANWLSTECARRETFHDIEEMYREHLMR